MKREYQRRPRSSTHTAADDQQLIDALSVVLAQASANSRSAQPDNEEDAVQIDLMEFFYHVLAKMKWIILAALLGALLAGLYSYYLVTPKYEATAKLYIMGQDEVGINLSDLQIGSMLTMDYQEVFETWEVHEMVRSQLNMSYTYTDMQQMLKVSNPDDTRILYITVTHEDPQLAADIANAYAQSGKSFILQTMDTQEPNVFSVALIPSKTVGTGKTTYVLLGFILGTALALCVIFLRFVLDDRPRTPDDIRKAAGIPTLAVIPTESQISKENKKNKGDKD